MGSKIQTEPEKKKLFNDVEGAASQVGKKKKNSQTERILVDWLRVRLFTFVQNCAE